MDHVTELKWHHFPTNNKEKKKTWVQLISKERIDFTPPNSSRISSNHFCDWKPTVKNSNPTLYLTPHDYRNITSKIHSRGTPGRKRNLYIEDKNDNNIGKM